MKNAQSIPSQQATTSGPKPGALDTRHLARELFSRLLGLEIDSATQIGGGRNSIVFRLETGGGIFAGKQYFSDPEDHRDRLRTECDCLCFLRRNNVENVPGVVACNPESRLGVFEYVEGESPAQGGVGEQDIDLALDFARTLAGLRVLPEAASQPTASEACFSPADAVQAIHRRLEPLRRVGDAELDRFLQDTFLPKFEKAAAWSRKACRDSGESFDVPIPRQSRTLSPSDFGFHNSIRRPDGSLVFLDFEYYGWDDPAKMTADFLLHPAMELTDTLRRRFVAGAAEIFGGENMVRRLRVHYPLAALKWCLLLLNVFMPGAFRRRGFAAGGDICRESLLTRQLARSMAMLEKVQGDHDDFPYAG